MQNELLKEQNLDNENKSNAILYDKSKYLFRLDRDFNFNKSDYQFDVNEKSSFDNTEEDYNPFSKINFFDLLNSNFQNDVDSQEINENIVNNDLDIDKEDTFESSGYVAEPVSDVEQVQPISNFQEDTPTVSVYEDDYARLASEKEYNTDTSIVYQEDQPIDNNETVNNVGVDLTNTLDNQNALDINSLDNVVPIDSLTIHDGEQVVEASTNNDAMIYPSISKNNVLMEDNTTSLPQDVLTLEEVPNNVSSEISLSFDSQNDDDVEIFDVNE